MHTGLHLFRASFLLLFLEAVLLRWVGAYLPFASFFTHHVLLGALLGVSLGFFLGERQERLIRIAPALLLVTASAIATFHWLFVEGILGVRVDDPHQPERLFFGTLLPDFEGRRLALPIEAGLLAVFTGTTLIAVGLGQRLGRLFESSTARLSAYAWHLAGGAAGTGTFALLAATGAGPVFWWFPAILLLGLECRTGKFALPITLGLVLWMEVPREGWERHWSPYNRIDYEPDQGLVFANGIGHQQLVDRGHAGEVYSLPYRIRGRAERVLVIGSGTGNDVVAALAEGMPEVVHAVDIDPVLVELGRDRHPARPYQDPRVTVFEEDGRAFLQREGEGYDCIVFGLVDSLTLHSSYGSVRLESYLFTREAFEAAKRRLNPGGVIVVTNYLRSGWLALRISSELEALFEDVRVFTLPQVERIERDAATSEGLTMIVAGTDLPSRVTLDDLQLTDTPREDAAIEPATDDWPYPYLHRRSVPTQNRRALASLLGVALLVGAFLRIPVRSTSRHFLMLGVGFALIQTTSLTRLAAVLGTTWQMHTAVVTGALAMSLGGLLLARAPAGLCWAGLAAGVATSALLDASALLSLPAALSAALLLAPLFFSSGLFARALAASDTPTRDLGSNALGVLLGIALESLSVVLGLRGMGVLVALAYLAAFRRR